MQAAAAAGGLRFGSAVAANARGGLDNPRYAGLVAAECGLVVPENEMKWRALQPTPGAYRFEAADRIVRWAACRRLAVRGRNLLWCKPKCARAPVSETCRAGGAIGVGGRTAPALS
ncbi:MAG: endo-1,4-beta-xylanase [Caulobacteraceae bacterium]|nr:endo-1,4-beta-xylanase [Caulobacter sp.]